MILLVDDNAVQAATRQAILKSQGHRVIAVLSAERALEQFRNDEFPGTVDLVVTDHIMPGMTGAQLISRIREFDPAVAVLVISGMAEAEDEYAGLHVEFRLKPLPPDDLIATVNGLVQANATR